MAQFTQRFRLNLANPLARYIKLFTDLFKRVIRAHLDPEAHPQNLGLARRQRIQHLLNHIVHGSVQGSVGRSEGRGVLNEIAKVRIIVITDRRLH